MAKFRSYDPGQAWLLPPNVRDVLGEEHLSFFVHEVVERLNLQAIEDSYSEEGQPGYHPRLMLKLWLYAYCLGITSSRRLEQRTREDLGFRYLAAEATPDFWTLNTFRRRHGKALNDVFTQVVEFAREQGLGRLGHVAIDSTRIAASASRERTLTEEKLRSRRAAVRRQIRRWQKQCNEESAQEAGGTQVETNAWRQKLEQIPRQLKQLRKSGLKKLSETDPDSRFLRTRSGFELGYTADIAVSEDHLVVAQRITQNPTDTRSLDDMVEQVEQRCGETPRQVSADSGFYRNEEIQAVTERGTDVYVPDSNMAQELNGGPSADRTAGCIAHYGELVSRMRAKLRTPEGRAIYQKRKGLVEPVFGTIKEQRQGRRFRLRGLKNVAVEFCLMTLAYNLTRLHQLTSLDSLTNLRLAG
jgi:transposase